MKLLRNLVLLFALLLLLLPGSVFGDVVKQEKLELVRDQITLPELSSEEKLVLVEQAQILLRDLYVHRYAKQNYYFDVEDPVLSIADVVAKVDEMTTLELETELFRIFASQRDLHLNYRFPAPYNTYTSFLPLTFTRAVGFGNYFQVRVSAVNKEMFEQFAQDQQVPEVGDELIFYDNKMVWQAIHERIPESMGANLFGGFSRSLGLFTRRYHKYYPVPEENEVTLVLRSHKRGHRAYTITVPWVAQWTEPEAIRIMTPEKDEKERFNLKKRFDLAVDDQQIEYNAFLRRNKLEGISAYPSNPSNEPVLAWGVIENRYGRFGYLRLDSFYPDNGAEFTLQEIRRLLLAELYDTDGLIFDVRNNGGGAITLADQLSQFFMSGNAQVLKSRLLNSDLNYRLFTESVLGDLFEPVWRQLVEEAHGTGRMYTDGSVFTTEDKANELGQNYYKPVAVLANARSYSATDMFTCAMQDNKAALVYGEDPTTGAGGANVIDHELFALFVPEEFNPLPGSHTMRFSWRQTVRFGQNEGRLIEDYGCYANRDVSKNLKDVLTGGEDQILRITSDLARRASFYKGYARGEQETHELYLSKDNLRYGVFVVDTDNVSVMLNGEPYQEISVSAHDEEVFVDVDLPEDLPAGQIARIAFIGKDKQGRVLWNLKRHIIVLAERIPLGPEGFEIDFSAMDDMGPVTVINNSAPEGAWSFAKPYLQVGYNPEYANSADTDAVLFFDLTNVTSAHLSAAMDYFTEEGWDFIQIYVTNNITQTALFAGSGEQALKTFEFDISQFAGQDNVAVHFRFTSDSNTTAPGVRIHNIQLK